ncbi:glutaredoxin domain-containing protein [Amycolatopsis sp., V23-08]|jgi:glutaredoxin|uniref:Glutaredoxin domain-containing protein n=1 Tax=Amycolatopsis heterodermiae TaxID=3110235 RepID=A0ABU5QZH1_9PSEU|nr:glutaredoxin domain-containing protein [Amycolatopsis sp., V23-08]MDT7796986.1 mycoredoxin [Actinomycetota bacterium]MEA5359306.1 glutaredoxin domain-containing protein [Amycolatopsis sp., V23-08]
MSNVEVEFYWRPGCGFCAALDRPMSKSGFNVRKINIWEDPSAAARVREVANGNETVPTVIVGSVAMVNPSFAEVEAAVKAAQAA